MMQVMMQKDQFMYMDYVNYKIYHFIRLFHGIQLKNFISEYMVDEYGNFHLSDVMIYDMVDETSTVEFVTPKQQIMSCIKLMSSQLEEERKLKEEKSHLEQNSSNSFWLRTNSKLPFLRNSKAFDEPHSLLRQTKRGGMRSTLRNSTISKDRLQQFDSTRGASFLQDPHFKVKHLKSRRVIRNLTESLRVSTFLSTSAKRIEDEDIPSEKHNLEYEDATIWKYKKNKLHEASSSNVQEIPSFKKFVLSYEAKERESKHTLRNILAHR